MTSLVSGQPALARGSLPGIERVLAAQLDALQAFGVPLVSYEGGGQHFLAAGSVQFHPQLNALFPAANREPGMPPFTDATSLIGNW